MDALEDFNATQIILKCYLLQSPNSNTDHTQVCTFLSKVTRYRQHLQHSMKLNSTICYTAANLKLISVKCLTHVFNPSTYVLVFVARIQDASFPPTHVSTQEYNITNSMYKLLCSNIKNSNRKVGSTKLIRLLLQL